MSKIYKQLCTALKNKSDTEIEAVLNLIKNIKNKRNHEGQEEIDKFQELLRTEFNNYLLGNNIDITDETAIKVKLQQLGFKVNNTKRPRAKQTDANSRPTKRARLVDEYTSTLPDFFVPNPNGSGEPSGSKPKSTVRPKYTKMERNFFTPQPIRANKNSLFTEFELANSIQEKPKTRKKDSLTENVGFIEQLKHALENPKQIKKMTFKSLCLAEIEIRVAECVNLVSNADLPTKTKFHFYSCILDRAHNLYLENEARINIEPEKFPFTICLG